MPSCDAEKDASFDAWMLPKLRLDWSSHEFGGLLTPSKLAEARALFSHLDPPIKVRLMLALLSVRSDELATERGREEVKALFDRSAQDPDEWVKITSELVKQFLMVPAPEKNRPTPLEATAGQVVDTITSALKRRRGTSCDDVFSLENGLLNPPLRPLSAPSAVTHFTVRGDDDESLGKEDEASASPVKKKPVYRPPIARPSGLLPSSMTAPMAAPRASQALKGGGHKTGKAGTDLSSAIRRKADAGRFKRQRSRISMIDINEVKQIESEKALKAEERKKQKVAAKEREKEKVAKEKEKQASGKSTLGAAVPVVVHDEHAAIAADIFAMHHQLGSDDAMAPYPQHAVATDEMSGMPEVTPPLNGDEYVPDGTQALLNAAFHSTQDIMKEVVSQQTHPLSDHQPLQQQSTYHDVYRSQPQMQVQHLVPPQPPYHQGFEPEEASLPNASASGLPMAFGSYNYTGNYYGDQFGNYGNAFNSTGFVNAAMGQQEASMGLPPLSTRQMGYDPTQAPNQHQSNGGYMGGSNEYWR